MTDFAVRPAISDDALSIIVLLRDLEPDNDLLFYGVDPTRTDTDQRTLIETLPDNSLLLVAEVGGEVVGYLECRGGTFPAVQHCARIAVMVRSDRRSRRRRLRRSEHDDASMHRSGRLCGPGRRLQRQQKHHLPRRSGSDQRRG